MRGVIVPRLALSAAHGQNKRDALCVKIKYLDFIPKHAMNF